MHVHYISLIGENLGEQGNVLLGAESTERADVGFSPAGGRVVVLGVFEGAGIAPHRLARGLGEHRGDGLDGAVVADEHERLDDVDSDPAVVVGEQVQEPGDIVAAAQCGQPCCDVRDVAVHSKGEFLYDFFGARLVTCDGRRLGAEAVCGVESDIADSVPDAGSFEQVCGYELGCLDFVEDAAVPACGQVGEQVRAYLL